MATKPIEEKVTEPVNEPMATPQEQPVVQEPTPPVIADIEKSDYYIVKDCKLYTLKKPTHGVEWIEQKLTDIPLLDFFKKDGAFYFAVKKTEYLNNESVETTYNYKLVDGKATQIEKLPVKPVRSTVLGRFGQFSVIEGEDILVGYKVVNFTKSDKSKNKYNGLFPYRDILAFSLIAESTEAVYFANHGGHKVLIYTETRNNTPYDVPNRDKAVMW